MINNYIITSLRYLIRNKWITLINIIGLTFGVTFSILIGLYVKRELSVDKSFKDRDRIYRFESQLADKPKSAVTTSAIGPDLKNSLPQIESVLRIQFTNKLILKNDKEEYYTIQKVCLADSTFFDFFEQEWVFGAPENSLNIPRSLVLTDELALAIFGNTNPVGKTLKSQSGRSVFTVAGVIKKSKNSHIPYDALLSMVTIGLNDPTILNTYKTHQWSTYFKLAHGADPKSLENQLLVRLFEIAPNYVNKVDHKDLTLALNPLSKIYLDRATRDIEVVHGNVNLVKVFIAIAILIIVIACINFINLSTAKAMKRAKEVGLKKLVGSGRSSLIAQFLVESFIISLFSTLLGVLIAESILPYFSNLIGIKIDITYFDNPYTIPFLIVVILVTGLIAGLYPAYYISSYSALQSIRAEFTKGKKSVGFRRGLILLQFFISVLLINGSLLIHKQLKYTDQKDLGFDKERILTIQMNGAVYNNRNIIREKLLQDPDIINVSSSYTIPGSFLNYEGFEINNKEINPMVLSIDPYYLKAFDIKLIAGRDFDENLGTDSISNCIINETLAKEIGLENPIDAVIQHDDWYITMFPVSNIRIIGVVKDFHFKSFRNAIQPLMLAWNQDWHSYLNIKIAEGKIAPAMKKIKEIINEFAPNIPLEYQFIDDSFDKMYKSDERMSKTLIYFTVLAILISVLGLVGIVTFSAEQRKKEVAIRKVLGASIVSINKTLSMELTLIVVIANAIGWPLVVWLGSKWLNEFVYKTTITPYIFIVGAIISITIALITILAVTTKTANLNPAESLSCE